MWISLVLKYENKNEIFAATSMKLKRTKGYFKKRFGNAENASKDQDKEGNYIIERDPTHFGLIMDFVRDGATSFPKFEHSGEFIIDVVGVEEMLVEADYYELGPLVLQIVEKLKGVKFTETRRRQTF